MTQKKCRWGFLSTAEIGQKNWLAIKNAGNATVAAVASRSREKSEAFVDRCQSVVPFDERPQAIQGYEALLSDDSIDAVYVPLPTGMRKEWVIKAASAGKHVMCEKPCAVTADDLRQMIDACTENGVQFMDGVMYMHSGRMDAMRQALDDPAQVGDFKRITSQFSFRAPEEFKKSNIRTDSRLEPHGCLGDLGWYTIRFALWVMKYQMPVAVTGRILESFQRPDSPASVPMEFSGELFFEGGISANFYNSFLTQHQQWANVSGTAGYLHVDDFVLPFKGEEMAFRTSVSDFRVNDCDFEMVNETKMVTVEEAGNSSPNSQETRLFRCFSELVNSGQLDQHWPEIALKTQTVLDACLRSGLRDGAKIDMNATSKA